LDEDTLKDLDKKITAFEAVRSVPRQKVATSKSATQQLPKLFRRLDALFERRLDKLVVKYQAMEPAFVDEYFAARKVVKRGGRHAKSAQVPVNTATPANSSTLLKAA